jgi:hypothetical protein
MLKVHLVLDTCIDVFTKVANDRRCHATVGVVTGATPCKPLSEKGGPLPFIVKWDSVTGGLVMP